MNPSLGLWIDCPASSVTRETYWEELKFLGIRTAAIMIDSMNRGWDLVWSQIQLKKAAQLAREHDIELVLTTWPMPDKEDIDRMAASMRLLLPLGVSAWEIDCEHLWRTKHLRGFPGLKEAGLHLAAVMHSICDPLDVRLELTTHGGHRESSDKAQFSHLMDRLVIQAYSVRLRQGEKIDWTDREGPGLEQHRSIKRAHGVPGLDCPNGPRLSVGLAIFSQKWPGHEEREAFTIALDTAAEYGPAEIRLWSSKWLMGMRRQSWIYNELRRRAV